MPKKENHGNKTASKAAKTLADSGKGFVIPTAAQKKRILIAFALKNKVVYGKAYDAVKVSKRIDLNSDDSVQQNIDKIKLYEIKSTNRDLDKNFKGYFFALTTAELLVAQNLKQQYKFVFVNIYNRHILEQSLSQVMAKAKGFYPQWSISF